VRFVFTAASKDLRRRLADPTALLIWIGVPILIGGLIRLVSGGGGVPKAHLLLVDRDSSFVSKFAAGAGRQAGASQFLDIEEVTLEEGQRRIDEGDGTALVVIPAGFEDAVLNETPTEITLITNPAQRILPRIVEEGLRITAEAAFYVQRLFGEPIREIAAARGQGAAPADDLVAALGRSFNQRIGRVRSTLLPPVIKLETKTESDRSATTSGFGTLFMPGLLFMSLLFMANGMSLDVWVEKERGTLRRTMTTPQRLASFLAGKLVASLVLMGGVSAIALLLGVLAFNVPLRRVPIGVLWGCYAGAAIFCYLVLLQLLASTARGAGILGQLVVFPLMMLGGSFFPFEAMPDWMARIGRWTPNGQAVARMRDLLFGEPDARSMAVAVVLIGVTAAIAFLIGVRRLGGRFSTG
jgi:ABC-type Na+ efflux pump permease subunit